MTDENIKNAGSVLLIDDDKFLLDMYSVKFTQAGFTVNAQLSVSKAIEALRAGFKPDAVVFDLVMPQENGFSLLEKLRSEKLAQGAALVALSNQSDETEKKHTMELGATRYIVKASMIPSEVVDAVGQEIKKSKAS